MSEQNTIMQFEEEIKNFTGAKYAIACCNGTAALHTALRAVGVTNGDKVITTPFSFIASANSILYCGATPIFVDIDPKTYCLDANLVEETLRENDVDTILCVHLFGNCCDMSTFVSIAKRYDVHLVEDCAQAFGAKYDDIHVGNFGDVGTFSFYATKNLSTFEGGMVITNSDELAKKARMIINQGQSIKYRHDILGYNYRMPQICALIGLTQLKLHKKGILAELGSYGIKQGHYPYVIYDQPLYKKLGIKGNCQNAEKVAMEARKYWQK